MRTGDFADFEVLADGSVMTAWCLPIGSRRCLFAFKIATPDGGLTYGRLPGFAGSWSGLVAAGQRFLVDVGNRHHDLLLINQRGRGEKVQFSPTQRPLAAGDVLVRRRIDAESAIVVRPSARLAFVVRTPGTNRLTLSSDGTLWGASAAYGTALQVRWSTAGVGFRSYTYDTGAGFEYGSFQGGVVASQDHAAVFSCGDVASGQVCDHKLAVTSNHGATWVVRDFASLPVKDAGSSPGSVVVAGRTLVLAQLTWSTRGRQRTDLWRSIDPGWTRFEKLATIQGAVSELTASRTSVWMYRIPQEAASGVEDFTVRALLKVELSGEVSRITLP